MEYVAKTIEEFNNLAFGRINNALAIKLVQSSGKFRLHKENILTIEFKEANSDTITTLPTNPTVRDVTIFQYKNIPDQYFAFTL